MMLKHCDALPLALWKCGDHPRSRKGEKGSLIDCMRQPPNAGFRIMQFGGKSKQITASNNYICNTIWEPIPINPCDGYFYNTNEFLDYDFS